MAAKTCALGERLPTIVDPRRPGKNLRHSLGDLIVLGFCGVGRDPPHCGLPMRRLPPEIKKIATSPIPDWTNAKPEFPCNVP